MNKKRCVVIFVRNRLKYFEELISIISSLNLRIFILDDSNRKDFSIEVSKISTAWNCTYINETYYFDFISKLNLPEPTFSFLLRKPGNENWNLGYSRNLALLITKFEKYEEVAFFDDDILPNTEAAIIGLFEKLRHYDFVGSRIVGLIDDSIIGHIKRQIGESDSFSLISGGCLFFTTKHISNYFLNIYNEDWIWLLLSLSHNSFSLIGTINQQGSNPFEYAHHKVIFQEFGEISLNGVRAASNNQGLLTELHFWDKIIEERIKYLNQLNLNKSVFENTEFFNLVNVAILEVKSISNSKLVSLFSEYFMYLRSFQSLYNSI